MPPVLGRLTQHETFGMSGSSKTSTMILWFGPTSFQTVLTEPISSAWALMLTIAAENKIANAAFIPRISFLRVRELRHFHRATFQPANSADFVVMWVAGVTHQTPGLHGNSSSL